MRTTATIIGLAAALAVTGCSAPQNREAVSQGASAPAAADEDDARVKDHVEAAILAALLGDALGKGVEGFGLNEDRRDDIPADYLTGEIRALPIRDESERFPDARLQPPGTYTDDSEEMLAVLISLNDRGGAIDQIDTIRALGETFHKEHGYSDRTAGLIAALVALPDPTGWRTVTFAEERGRMTYESNGCAMRVSPIGLVALRASDQELRRMVIDACAITHPAPISTEGAIAVAKATQLALRAGTARSAAPFDRQRFFDDVIATIRLSDSASDPLVIELVTRIERARALVAEVEALRATSPEKADALELERMRDSAYLGVGFNINNVIPGVIYLAARYMGDVERGLGRSVVASIPGDTDTVPAMVGAILGAYQGTKGVPERWLSLLYDVNEDGSPTAAWLRSWEAIWRGKLGLTVDQIPARFDMRFLPLRRIRDEARQLGDIVNGRD